MMMEYVGRDDGMVELGRPDMLEARNESAGDAERLCCAICGTPLETHVSYDDLARHGGNLRGCTMYHVCPRCNAREDKAMSERTGNCPRDGELLRHASGQVAHFVAEIERGERRVYVCQRVGAPVGARIEGEVGEWEKVEGDGYIYTRTRGEDCMSRSRRHTPLTSWTTNDDNEQWFKRHAHKSCRRRNRVRLAQMGADFEPVALREVSDCWTWPKDGKQWLDVRQYPESMRK